MSNCKPTESCTGNAEQEKVYKMNFGAVSTFESKILGQEAKSFYRQFTPTYKKCVWDKCEI